MWYHFRYFQEFRYHLPFFSFDPPTLLSIALISGQAILYRLLWTILLLSWFSSNAILVSISFICKSLIYGSSGLLQMIYTGEEGIFFHYLLNWEAVMFRLLCLADEQDESSYHFVDSVNMSLRREKCMSDHQLRFVIFCFHCFYFLIKIALNQLSFHLSHTQCIAYLLILLIHRQHLFYCILSISQ